MPVHSILSFNSVVSLIPVNLQLENPKQTHIFLTLFLFYICLFECSLHLWSLTSMNYRFRSRHISFFKLLPATILINC